MFIAVLGVLVFTSMSIRLLGDAGIGWHIRTGQWILANHEIPSQVDPFSSSFLHPWFAWEWLYDIAVGKLEAWRGLNGVVWFNAIFIAATFAWMFRMLLRSGTNLFAALILWLLSISAASIHFLARPHLVSWLFTLAWFFILETTETAAPPARRRLWILPALMLVWVNVHGGFLIGFVLLGIFWVSALSTWLRTKENRIEDAMQKLSAGQRTRTLTWVGLATAAASFANPYGWKLHAHIFSYLTNSFLMDHIDEFQSPNFHGVAQKCFLALLLVAFVAVSARGRRIRLSSALTMLFAIYAGLYASRNIPIAAIFLALIIGPLLAGWDFGFSRRMGAIDLHLKGHVWPVVFLAMTLAIAASGGRLGSTRLMDAHFDRQRMPVAAASFLKQSDIRGPIFAPDYWGGYLIFRLYPQSRVVIDDRHDFYGESYLRLYVTTIHLEPGWEDFLGRAACLVVPKNAALTAILSRTHGWRLIYSDDVAVVFTRATNSEGNSDGSPGS